MSALPQHEVALKRANSVRLERAALKAGVTCLGTVAGTERVASLLLDPPAAINTLNVFHLLCWVHRIGRLQARRLLRSLYALTTPVHVSISEFRQVGQLTERERVALAKYLRGERVL